MAKKLPAKSKKSGAKSTNLLGVTSKFNPATLAISILVLAAAGYFVVTTFAGTKAIYTACPYGTKSAAADPWNGIDKNGWATIYGVGGKRTGQVIKICRAWDFKVRQSTVGDLRKMVIAAYKDGVGLKPVGRYSGWRSYNMQQELRRQNGCPRTTDSVASCNPDTAKPGTSNHEAGEAMDFANASTRNTAVYRWLSKNARSYGFYNLLTNEPWHWSRNGR